MLRCIVMFNTSSIIRWKKVRFVFNCYSLKAFSFILMSDFIKKFIFVIYAYFPTMFRLQDKYFDLCGFFSPIGNVWGQNLNRLYLPIKWKFQKISYIYFEFPWFSWYVQKFSTNVRWSFFRPAIDTHVKIGEKNKIFGAARATVGGEES